MTKQLVGGVRDCPVQPLRHPSADLRVSLLISGTDLHMIQAQGFLPHVLTCLQPAVGVRLLPESRPFRRLTPAAGGV